MFNHFRTYYPQGNLISELVKIDRGQYIVRAIATANNTPLATSLAAAATVEQAEDIARERLFALMDIPTADETSIPPKATLPPHTTPASPPPTQPEPVFNPPPTQSEPVFSPPPTQPEPILTPDPDLEVTEDFNFDAAIAQTDVELKRLGWSKTQGREYLQKTYGEDKIARKDLTAQELTSFLEYLRQQPNPPETVPPDFPSVSPASETVISPPPSETVVDPNFDFPETMSQINLEKKRLGWTKAQEQDYLLQTYGKRSRQLLMDQELAEYLDHLQSL
jgi:hypothetical protein